MLKSLNVLFALALIFSLASCDNESNEVVDVDNFVDATLNEMGEKCNFGRIGCFELVFPIDLVYVDGSSETVEDQESLIAAIKAWAEENPDKADRPSFAFPLEVLNEAGELISVDDSDALKELAKECRRDNFGKGKKDRTPCFDLVYPVSLTFEDGSSATFESKVELKQGVRAYKVENGRDAARPELVFPITVVDEDGEETVVDSIEDLQALKEACQE